MHTLGRYINHRILTTVTTVLIVLITIFTFFSFIDEIEDVGTGTYDLLSAIYVVVLEIPNLSYDLMPFATLIGTMIALGSFVELNEIVVIRSSGGSKIDLLITVLKSACFLAIFTIVVGELIAPFAESQATKIKTSLKKDRDLTLMENGFWAREGNTFINMRSILIDGIFSDVSIYEFNDRGLLGRTATASSAEYEDDVWYLNDVRETLFEESKVSVAIHKKVIWQSSLDPRAIEMVAMKPTTHTALSLYRYWKFAKANGQRADNLERSLWAKVGSPLSIFAMVIFALPLVVSSQRDVSLSRRVLASGFMGLGYHVICELSEQMSAVYGLPASASILVPPTALLIFAVGLNYRAA